MNTFKSAFKQVLVESLHQPLLEAKAEDLDLEPDHRFDVVVGNPPYQEGAGGSSGDKLYNRFIEFGNNSLHKGGYLSMVTPTGWTTGSSRGKGVLEDIFLKNNLLYANVDSDNLQKKHFKGVGSTFSYFLMKRSPQYSGTVIEFEGKTSKHNLKRLELGIPAMPTKHCFSITNKFLKPSDKVENAAVKHCPATGAGKGKIYNTKQTNKFKHKLFHTPAEGGTMWYHKEKHPHHNKSKVLVSISGHYEPRLDKGNMGYTSMCMCFLSDNADNMFSYLNSKLYKYMFLAYRQSGFSSESIIRNLPKLDDTRKWTDESVYNHFNISQEERKHIEEVVCYHPAYVREYIA